MTTTTMDQDQQRLPDIYGPGTYTDAHFTPVPLESARVFRLLASQTPGFTKDESLLSLVHFTSGGNRGQQGDDPILPGPIKAGAVSAALHGMIGLVAHEIFCLRNLSLKNREKRKRKIQINTTHATLWLGSISLVYLDGQKFSSLASSGLLNTRYKIPDWQGNWQSTPLRLRATGIYPTKTPGRWYSLHGSLDQPPMLRHTLGIDIDADDIPEIDTPKKAAEHIASHTKKFSPEELEMRNIMGGFCGSICFTPQEWRESEMGKALARRPLVDTKHQRQAVPPPAVPFSGFASASEGETTLDGSTEVDRRPLKGVKILELTRIIASPTIGVILSSLGASVIRISAPHLRDISALQLTLNAGKQTLCLDLRSPADRSYLDSLLSDADVFIQGFRPSSLEKFSLGVNDLLSMASRRGKGMIYVSENCYGPDGVYSTRPGWQQVADCASGASYAVGRSLDLLDQECVLPPLPISDMLTGLVGALGTLIALRERATRGRSYVVNCAIVGVNCFMLSREVGLYSREVVEKCRERFRWGEMRAESHVLDLVRVVMKGWEGDEEIKGLLKEDGGLFCSWTRDDEGAEEEGGEGRRRLFGAERLSVLRPVVRFVTTTKSENGDCDEENQEEEEETGVTPEWKTASVPHGWDRKEHVHF